MITSGSIAMELLPSGRVPLCRPIPRAAFFIPDRSSIENGRSCFEINDDCGVDSDTRIWKRAALDHKSAWHQRIAFDGPERMLSRCNSGQSSPFMAPTHCGESELTQAFFEQRGGAALFFACVLIAEFVSMLSTLPTPV